MPIYAENQGTKINNKNEKETGVGLIFSFSIYSPILQKF